MPVPGLDFDDGIADIVVYRQSTGVWSIRPRPGFTSAFSLGWGGLGYAIRGD